MLDAAEILVREERWSDIAQEADVLAAMHFREVDEGVEPRRPYKLDKRLMQLIADSGALSITAARNGAEKLIGYCSWIVKPDVESEGLLIAEHGPWFVLPEHP